MDEGDNDVLSRRDIKREIKMLEVIERRVKSSSKLRLMLTGLSQSKLATGTGDD